MYMTNSMHELNTLDAQNTQKVYRNVIQQS